MNEKIKKVESKYMKADPISIKSGNYVYLKYKISPDAYRNFDGIVIATRSRGISSSFKVLKWSSNTSQKLIKKFFIHSDNFSIIKIEKNLEGRRAKLNYMINLNSSSKMRAQ